MPQTKNYIGIKYIFTADERDWSTLSTVGSLEEVRITPRTASSCGHRHRTYGPMGKQHISIALASIPSHQKRRKFLLCCQYISFQSLQCIGLLTFALSCLFSFVRFLQREESMRYLCSGLLLCKLQVDFSCCYCYLVFLYLFSKWSKNFF